MIVVVIYQKMTLTAIRPTKWIKKANDNYIIHIDKTFSWSMQNPWEDLKFCFLEYFILRHCPDRYWQYCPEKAAVYPSLLE